MNFSIGLSISEEKPELGGERIDIMTVCNLDNEGFKKIIFQGLLSKPEYKHFPFIRARAEDKSQITLSYFPLEKLSFDIIKGTDFLWMYLRPYDSNNDICYIQHLCTPKSTTYVNSIWNVWTSRNGI